MTIIDTPTHGATRNYGRHVTTATKHWRDATTGEAITVTHQTGNHPKAEKWCGVCEEWKMAKGLMGFIGCPTCGQFWKDAPNA